MEDWITEETKEKTEGRELKIGGWLKNRVEEKDNMSESYRGKSQPEGIFQSVSLQPRHSLGESRLG